MAVVNRYLGREEPQTEGGSANIRPQLQGFVSEGLGVTEQTIAAVPGSGALAAVVRTRLKDQRAGLETVARELHQAATVEAKLRAGWFLRVDEFLHGCHVRRDQ